jgi:exosortase H (IPTLxxWG-CTERM-specific)
MAGRRARPRPAEKRTAGRHAPRDRLTLSGLVRSERFRFAAAFGLSCLGFYALASALPSSFVRVLCAHTARALGHVLNVIGFPVAVGGNIVSGSGPVFQIVLECTALSTAVLFACFVSFYPTEARKKATGLAVGIPALYLGNLVRLVSTFVVTQHYPGLFELVHVYLGQVFTMLLLILACILWLKWVNPGSPAGPVHKAAGFLGLFALISGCMFLFWMEVHHGYIWLIDRFMIFGFSLFGHRVFVPQYAAVYYETFGVVTFTSLILATRSVKWSTKAKALAVGLCLLFLLHLFHRIDNALWSAFHYTSLIKLDVFLCDVGQYLLPVLLWLAVAAHVLPRKNKSPNSSRPSAPSSTNPKRKRHF